MYAKRSALHDGRSTVVAYRVATSRFAIYSNHHITTLQKLHVSTKPSNFVIMAFKVYSNQQPFAKIMYSWNMVGNIFWWNAGFQRNPPIFHLSMWCHYYCIIIASTCTIGLQLDVPIKSWKEDWLQGNRHLLIIGRSTTVKFSSFFDKLGWAQMPR